jgi:hypothetical protein
MEKLRQGPMLHLGVKGLDDDEFYHMTKSELENTNVNNSILKICTLFSYLAPYKKHPDDG